MKRYIFTIIALLMLLLLPAGAQKITLGSCTTKDGGEYQVEIVKVDDNTLTLENLWGGEEKLTGTIEFDEDANTATITFPARQVVMDASAYGYGNLLLIGQNDAGNWAYAPVKASVSIAGISIGPWNMVITDGAYTGYIWGNSYQTELTR